MALDRYMIRVATEGCLRGFETQDSEVQARRRAMRYMSAFASAGEDPFADIFSIAGKLGRIHFDSDGRFIYHNDCIGSRRLYTNGALGPRI